MRLFGRRTRNEKDGASIDGPSSSASSERSAGSAGSGGSIRRIASLERGSSLSEVGQSNEEIQRLLRPKLNLHVGIPAGCLKVAFSRSQRIVALGSADGRVKVI